MQTKCPHCQTVFKVSDEHLKAADGYVRCGICKEVFNALEDKAKKQPLGNRQTQPATSTKQNIGTDKTSPDNSNTRTGVTQGAESPAASNQATPPENKATLEKKINQPTVAAKAPDNSTQTDMFTTASETTEPEARPAPAAPKTTAQATDEVKAMTSETPKKEPVKTVQPVTAIKAETESKEQISGMKESDNDTLNKAIEKPSAPIVSTPSPATTATTKDNVAEGIANDAKHDTRDNNLFDGVQSKLIPDEFRIPELHNTYSIGQDLIWSLAILALTASLFAEYAWFHRNELVHNPQLRPVVSYFCTIANCNVIGLREPDKIEMITRNIYTHPNVNNALMISGTLVNHAQFEQAYPNILIDFSDVRGEVIASRTFTPEDYLQIKATSLRPLAPELPIDFNIEIKDPGKDAMTYEFTFL